MDLLYPEPEDLDEILSYPFVLDENYNIVCYTPQDHRMHTKLIVYRLNQSFRKFDTLYAEMFDYEAKENALDDALREAGQLIETPSAQNQLLWRGFSLN